MAIERDRDRRRRPVPDPNRSVRVSDREHTRRGGRLGEAGNRRANASRVKARRALPAFGIPHQHVLERRHDRVRPVEDGAAHGRGDEAQAGGFSVPRVGSHHRGQGLTTSGTGSAGARQSQKRTTSLESSVARESVGAERSGALLSLLLQAVSARRGDDAELRSQFRTFVRPSRSRRTRAAHGVTRHASTSRQVP